MISASLEAWLRQREELGQRVPDRGETPPGGQFQQRRFHDQAVPQCGPLGGVCPAHGGEVAGGQLSGLLVAFGDGAGDERLGTGLQQQRTDAAVTQAPVEICACRAEDPVAARRQVGGCFGYFGEEAVVELPVQRHQEPCAVSEVVEERPLCHAGFLDDEVDAHAGQSGVLGQPQTRVEEVFAGGCRALLAGTHRDASSAAADAWRMRPSTAAWNRRFHRRVTSGRSSATGRPVNASTLLTCVPPPVSGVKLHR
jgi:hypothetical protein